MRRVNILIHAPVAPVFDAQNLVLTIHRRSEVSGRIGEPNTSEGLAG